MNFKMKLSFPGSDKSRVSASLKQDFSSKKMESVKEMRDPSKKSRSKSQSYIV